MPLTLTCYACGQEDTLPATRCSCGEPLWIDSDAGRASWDETAPTDMWHFADLLPVASPPGFGRAVGGTPLVRTAALDDYAGAQTHLKYEGANPTQSFKDRGSAVGVAHAAATGADAVGTVSHGNMALSMAAAAADRDVACVVLVPADIPAERLDAIAQFDPTIVQVEGDYGRLYDDSLDVGAELGVRFVNSDSPLRVAGQKTTALEICAQFGPHVPDAIVLPVSSGGHASAVWKALRELVAAGRLDADSLPRLYLAQAAACDPIAAAFRRGDRVVAPTTPGDTIAYSIANPAPPSGTRALTAARESGGAVVSVSDDEIREAKTRIARETGFCVETASATGVAATRTLSARGDVAADEDVVVVATGSGYNERTAATGGVSAHRAELGSLRSALSTLV